MSKLVAVQGCTFKYEPDPGGSVELAVRVPSASSKTSSGGNKAYTDKITIAVLSGTVVLNEIPEATPPATATTGTVPPGSITINGTSAKSKSQLKKYVLKGDEGSAVFGCVFPSASPPAYTTIANVTIKATVDNANQSVLKVT